MKKEELLVNTGWEYKKEKYKGISLWVKKIGFFQLEVFNYDPDIFYHEVIMRLPSSNYDGELYKSLEEAQNKAEEYAMSLLEQANSQIAPDIFEAMAFKIKYDDILKRWNDMDGFKAAVKRLEELALSIKEKGK